MPTVYIDIYFLINFTVDLLSLHMASVFTKIRLSAVGLLFSAAMGAIFAIVLLFVPENTTVFIFCSACFFSSIFLFTLRGCRAFRKIKYIIAFLFMQIIIGGLVYYFYGLLERNVSSGAFDEFETDRNLLLLSLMVLLSIGILKILLMLFKNNMSEREVKLKIVMLEKEYFVDALVDSGNFAVDPIDMSPIMIITFAFAKKIFPHGVPDIYGADSVEENIKKRIRLIPITGVSETKILCAFRADKVFVIKNNECEKINLTIAIDKEGGSFAGYDALISLAALENT